jgi:hypothetical protein
MAYRQAGMFVSYLYDFDASGFARMMNAILDGRPFMEAVDAGYHRDVRALWQEAGRLLSDGPPCNDPASGSTITNSLLSLRKTAIGCVDSLPHGGTSGTQER